jgi:hypothetical protein
MGSAKTEKKKRQRQRRAAGLPPIPPPPPKPKREPTPPRASAEPTPKREQKREQKPKREPVDESALVRASLDLGHATLARVLAAPCPVHAHGGPGASCWPLRSVATAVCDQRVRRVTG